MSTAMLQHHHLRGLGAPVSRTYYGNPDAQGGMIRPKFMPLDDENANIIDSNNQIQDIMRKNANPVRDIYTPPQATTFPISIIPNPDLNTVPYPVDYANPDLMLDPSTILQPAPPINYTTLPPSTPQIVTPQGTIPPTAAYTPIDPGGPFGTGNTGPAMLTPLVTPTGNQPVLSTQSGLLTPATDQSGMITIFGYTASPMVWLGIGIAGVWLASTLLSSGSSTTRRR